MESEKQIKPEDPIIPTIPTPSLLPQNGSLGVRNPFDRAQFLELYRQHFPDVTKVLRMMGLSSQLYHRTKDANDDFRAALNEIAAEHCDKVETVGYQTALTPRGFMDRIAFLRAHRPERWNPDSKVQVTHTLDPQLAAARARDLGQVIDAEPLPPTPPETTPQNQ